MFKMFENLSSKERVVLAAIVSIGVGLGMDQEVLSLLPPFWKLMIPKIITYGGGGTILYKMQPNSPASPSKPIV